MDNIDRKMKKYSQKVKAIIISCETDYHLDAAWNVINLFHKMFNNHVEFKFLTTIWSNKKMSLS